MRGPAATQVHYIAGVFYENIQFIPLSRSFSSPNAKQVQNRHSNYCLSLKMGAGNDCVGQSILNFLKVAGANESTMK